VGEVSQRDRGRNGPHAAPGTPRKAPHTHMQPLSLPPPLSRHMRRRALRGIPSAPRVERRGGIGAGGGRQPFTGGRTGAKGGIKGGELKSERAHKTRAPPPEGAIRRIGSRRAPARHLAAPVFIVVGRRRIAPIRMREWLFAGGTTTAAPPRGSLEGALARRCGGGAAGTAQAANQKQEQAAPHTESGVNQV
jgi:hypothetical protein